MHHELFLALLGHTGDVVERRVDGFFIRADVRFLSHAQKSVLDRLLRLGFAFTALDQFVRGSARVPSIYARALAQAVDRVLRRYADAVVALEAKTLRSSAVFPVSNMMFELESFMELLPELHGLVRKLQASTDGQPSVCIGGAKLLSLLHQRTSSGFPRVRQCMQELLCVCHRVLFKQILAWMVYGEIADPYGEFFIKKDSSSSSLRASETSQNDSADALAWHQQFAVDLEAVPLDYFPTAVAESVFVIGKAVHILTRAAQFSPREAQEVVTAISDLAQRPVFDAIALEHTVEKVRRHVAGRLHQEVVVKSDFVGYLRALKDFYLLSRGEVFQTFIESSFAMMLLKPTHKSEEDVNHGVWRQTIRDLLPEDESWSLDFDMQLPLQTFALKGFSSIDGLVLAGLSRSPNGKCLAVTPVRGIANPARSREADESAVEESGTVWWRHAQLDGNAFSCEFALQLEEDEVMHGSKRAVLLLKSEGALEPAILIKGSFELEDPQVSYVSVDLAIERLVANTNGVQVVARVKPSRGSDDAVRSSLAVDVPAVDSSSPTLRVRVQYARQEITTASSKQAMYKKVMAVTVNEVLVLETQLDLQQALRLHASNSEYWLGLAFSPSMQLAEWNLEKFSAKTSWRERSGSSLKERNAAVTPRELWHALRLRCAVRWPLQLLITPDLLRSYGHLFQFCFRLKRVAYALELAWKNGTLRSKAAGKVAPFAASALRSRMSFVVRTLELHFQVFVIGGKFSKCVAQIEAAADFDRAKRLHETFVASVVKSCYVHTKTVASALDELLSCCWRFAEYVLQQDAVAGELSSDRVAVLDQDFHQRFEFLYSVLQISEARDLLFLLDSNGFFAAERERRKQQQ